MINPAVETSDYIVSPLAKVMKHLHYCTLTLCLLLASCSAAKYRAAADREVSSIIAESERQVFGRASRFLVDTAYSNRDPEEISVEEIRFERSPKSDRRRKLTLRDALGIAIANNHAYQLQREQLYLSALALTGTRHQFTFRFTKSSADLGIGRSKDGGLKGDSDLDLTLSKVLKTGGQISTTLANDLVLYFDGKPKVPSITLTLTQPLLRGAGAAMAAEVLTQAERNVAYAIRNYSHYQKTFAIDTVTEYFRLLQSKDSVRNSYQNYIDLQKARDRAEALAEAERLPRNQVDQARQKELSARVSYLGAVESYRQNLDSFKQHLGLPLGESLQLVDAELEDLKRMGLPPLASVRSFTADDVYKMAVSRRLDVLNTIDKFEDTKRKVAVAANALQPSLSIVTDAGLADQFYSSFKPGQFTANAGLKLDLPLDQLTSRNAYRESLINFEKQLRTLASTLDELREDIREGVRALEQERENYEIQRNALKLAEQRVAVTPLLLEADEADIRDQLEAQADLVSAQNAVTRALVNYHVARWTLLKNLGAMNVESEQFWLEKQDLPGARANVVVPDGGLPNVDPPDKVFGN